MSYVQFHDNLYFNSLHPFTISIFGGTVQIICQKYIHINVYLLSELSTENAIDFIKALLPNGSPFGDPGPHGDLFQSLGPHWVPIGYH